MKIFTVTFKSNQFSNIFSRVFSTTKKADDFIQSHSKDNGIELFSSMDNSDFYQDFDGSNHKIPASWYDYRAEKTTNGKTEDFYYIVEATIIDEPKEKAYIL